MNSILSKCKCRLSILLDAAYEVCAEILRGKIDLHFWSQFISFSRREIETEELKASKAKNMGQDDAKHLLKVLAKKHDGQNIEEIVDQGLSIVSSGQMPLPSNSSARIFQLAMRLLQRRNVHFSNLKVGFVGLGENLQMARQSVAQQVRLSLNQWEKFKDVHENIMEKHGQQDWENLVVANYNLPRLLRFNVAPVFSKLSTNLFNCSTSSLYLLNPANYLIDQREIVTKIREKYCEKTGGHWRVKNDLVFFKAIYYNFADEKGRKLRRKLDKIERYAFINTFQLLGASVTIQLVDKEKEKHPSLKIENAIERSSLRPYDLKKLLAGEGNFVDEQGVSHFTGQERKDLEQLKTLKSIPALDIVWTGIDPGMRYALAAGVLRGGGSNVVASLALPSKSYYACSTSSYQSTLEKLKGDEIKELEKAVSSDPHNLGQSFTVNDGVLHNFYVSEEVAKAKHGLRFNQQVWMDRAVQSVLNAAGAKAHISATEYLGGINLGESGAVKRAFVFVFETGASFAGARKGERSPIHFKLQRHLIKKVSFI